MAEMQKETIRDHEQFRRVGQLEREGLEKLPLTPITPEATKTLKRWGLSEQHITEIRSFCSGFRYDRCVEKAERLVERPIFLRKENGKEVAYVPFYMDSFGRMDGQCGDIARQFIIQAEFTGLIDYLNANLQRTDGCRIATSYCTGISATHFCNQGSCHVWNSLVLLNRFEEVVDSVLTDASFQTISTEDESGYVLDDRTSDISCMSNMPIDTTTAVGWIEFHGTNIKGSIDDSIILGVSNDRKYAYGLGFARVKTLQSAIRNMLGSALDSHKHIAIISRISSDGSHEFFFLHPHTSTLTRTNSQEVLPDEEQAEIMAMLQVCQNFQFTSDFAKYPQDTNLGHTIRWDR